MQVQKDEHLAPPDDFAVALAEAAKAGPANAKMLQYVFEHYGKKIGDGECYAVAKEAMQHVGANPPSAATPCAPDPPRCVAPRRMLCCSGTNSVPRIHVHNAPTHARTQFAEPSGTTSAV